MQIVMGGDFNCALAPMDKTGGTSTERKKIVINKIKKKIIHKLRPPRCVEISTSQNITIHMVQ